MAAEDELLVAPYTLEYAYKRSTGPVIGRFLTGLRDGRIEGVKTQAGRVLVPPQEYDPETGEDVSDDFVEVGPGGVVTTWTWVYEPREKHGMDRPFAFALIRLDGADTALLHRVDAGDPDRMRTGMRVTVRWAEERTGMIHDIAAFVPEEAS
ncbi:MAG: OB-fold domain-containing protein [Phycisphaerales bacterium]|nr:OB-fold domain-containing protein [Phycisphaerales bacterium]